MKNMAAGSSMRTKLLSIICICYVLSTAIILFVSIVVTRQIINAENEKAYANQLEVMLRTLQKRQDKLISSGMESLFAEGYKQIHRQGAGEPPLPVGLMIYPFIIDAAGRVVLHPTLQPGWLSWPSRISPEICWRCIAESRLIVGTVKKGWSSARLNPGTGPSATRSRPKPRMRVSVRRCKAYPWSWP